MSRKKLSKFLLALSLSLSLTVRLISVPLILAQEGEPAQTVEATPAPSPTQEPQNNPDPSPSSEPSATPTLPPNDAPTGASPSPSPDPLIELLTDPTPNPDPSPSPCVPPSPTPTPYPDGIWPSPTPEADVTNTNSATICTNDLTAGQTGTNTIDNSAPADSTLHTGDSSSQSTGSTTANTTTPPEVVPDEDGRTPKIAFANVNQADVTTNTDVSSETGQNTVTSPEGSTTQIYTGDALAIANLINLLNLNLIDSSYTIATINITPEQLGDINLNNLWQELQAAHNSSDPQAIIRFLENHNYVTLTNHLTVNASTGSNTADGGDITDTQTGDAAAVGNVANVANANLIDSHFLIGFINILPDSTANIILPRPDTFFTTNYGTAMPQALIVSNTGSDTTDSSVTANTGNNAADGYDNGTYTGTAQAYTNYLSFSNLTLLNEALMSFYITNGGNWYGSLDGWTPADGEVLPNGVYQLADNGPATADGDGSVPRQVVLDNQAAVTNDINVNADTGNNSSTGDQNTIGTGNALAIANILDLINLNLIHSQLFMGFANVLGDWFGNVIFAYPDAVIGVSAAKSEAVPGEALTYTVSYDNEGYDTAKNVGIDFQLPDGTSYLSDSSGLPVTHDGGSVHWNAGDLAPKGHKSFTVQLKVNDDFDFANGQTARGWSLIPQAHAYDGKERTITVVGTISTSDPELSDGNNSSGADVAIFERDDSVDSEESESGTPELEVSAANNVNEFVYRGDTVTFEVKVKNSGDGQARDTEVHHYMFNGQDEMVGSASFKLGDIDAGKGGTLRFGMTLAKKQSFTAGEYYTVTEAVASAPDGSEVSSDTSETWFTVLGQALERYVSIPKAEAAAPSDTAVPPPLGQVLGLQCPTCNSKENIFPYVLLVFLSALWFVTRNNHKNTPTEMSGTKMLTMFMAYIIILMVSLYSVYRIGVIYGFLRPIPQLTAFYQKVNSRFVR